VLLESMACGVPVVATDVSDNAYVVKNGETGYLVSVGDDAALAESVLRILRDDDLREKMSRGSYDRIETEFSLKRLVDKMLLVYREVYDETARSH